ncbi:dnaJ homolog subfamily C member 12-like [Glandiceps talaboti]
MEGVFDYKPSDEEDFYKILGCDELSATEQINAEYRVRVREVHPDKNQDSPEAERKFHLLQKARDTLVNEESRKLYDAWRHSGLSVPYEQWLHLKKHVHVSMHWATKPRKEPMLEHYPSESSDIIQDTTQTVPGDGEAGASSSTQIDGRGNSTGGSSANWGWRNDSWSSDSPSETLRKFRNYEI